MKRFFLGFFCIFLLNVFGVYSVNIGSNDGSLSTSPGGNYSDIFRSSSENDYVALYRLLRNSGEDELTFSEHLETVETSLYRVSLSFRSEGILGYVKRLEGEGADKDIYSCGIGERYKLVLSEGDCLGGDINGLGKIWSTDAVDRVELFRCKTPQEDYFASTDPNCEGQMDKLSLGFIKIWDGSTGGKLIYIGAGPDSYGLSNNDLSRDDFIAECNSRKDTVPNNERLICKYGPEFVGEGVGSGIATVTQSEDNPNTGVTTSTSLHPYLYLVSYDSRWKQSNTYMDKFQHSHGRKDLIVMGTLESLPFDGTRMIYSCTPSDGGDMFTFDQSCEGTNKFVREEGYIWESSGDGRIPLYRCRSEFGSRSLGTVRNHFVTTDSTCEGENMENNGQPMGYINTYPGSLEESTDRVEGFCNIDKISINPAYYQEMAGSGPSYGVRYGDTIAFSVEYTNSECNDMRYSLMVYEKDTVNDDFVGFVSARGVGGSFKAPAIRDLFTRAEVYIKVGDVESELITIIGDGDDVEVGVVGEDDDWRDN